MNWLASQKLEHREQRIAFEEMLLAVRASAGARSTRLEQAIRAAVPDWSLAEVVTALMAMRGLDLVSATIFLAEIGDLSRFASPRELMGYLGLVPSEHSTGDRVKRARHHQGRQRPGAAHSGRVLLELPASAAARQGEACQGRSRTARPSQRSPGRRRRGFAARYRALTRRGKRPTVVVTAIARELSGFIWAVSRAVASARDAGAAEHIQQT